MLDRLFSLTQRKDESPRHFLGRVAIRVFGIVGGLVAFAIIAVVLFPILFGLPYAFAQFLGGFLVILGVLSAGAAVLGGTFTLIQLAWRIGAGRSLMMEVVPNVLQIIILFIVASFPAYLFWRGLMLGEIDHLSHRIKEIYRADIEPVGYAVHMALYLAACIMLYWYTLKLAKDLVGKFRALTRRSKGRLPASRQAPLS